MSGEALGPSVWTVSDGRAGNLGQVRAIAQALGETRRWIQIAHIAGEGHRNAPLTFTPRAPWTWLPPAHWPMPLKALPKTQASELTAPWPTVWIAAGRRSAPYSAAMRDWTEGRTLVVHVLDPGMSADKFDILTAPAHDGLSNDNVIATTGAPSYFSPEDIETAGLAFADLADERGRSAVVALGGDSKAHKFDRGSADALADKLHMLAGSGWRLRITASRRTPVPVRARFRDLADEIGARFWEAESDGPNPYLAWLVFSDVAIITEDSANMLSDAAYFGLPIHIAKLSGGSEKFKRLHESFIQRGCARWLTGALESWSYEPLREADRVADAIVAELLKRHPQPDIKPIDDKTAPPDWMG